MNRLFTSSATSERPTIRRPRSRRTGARLALTLPILAWLLVASMHGGVPETVAFDGIALARTRSVGDRELHLYSAGLLRKGLVFRVYAAALYLPTGHTPDALANPDVPRALEIIYLRDLPARAMVDVGGKALADNLPPAQLAAIQTNVAWIHALYRDVRRNDRYLLGYCPEHGVELSLNGVLQGRIADGWPFARDYLTIWLGPHAASRSVRNGLRHPLP